jgi:hypothetical protein
MPRALSIHRTTVPAGERARYLQRVKATKAHYTANGCRFWVFEQTGLSGAFLEFTEAPDEKTLVAAHERLPERLTAGPRVYAEIELV